MISYWILILGQDHNVKEGGLILPHLLCPNPKHIHPTILDYLDQSQLVQVTFDPF